MTPTLSERNGVKPELLQLLPCPFCGGKAEITKKGTAWRPMIVGCADCGCLVTSGDVAGLTAIENYAWNKRSPASSARRGRDY